MTSTIQHLLVLKDEVNYLKTQTDGGGKGYIYTTISTLESRIKEIIKDLESKNG